MVMNSMALKSVHDGILFIVNKARSSLCVYFVTSEEKCVVGENAMEPRTKRRVTWRNLLLDRVVFCCYATLWFGVPLPSAQGLSTLKPFTPSYKRSSSKMKLSVMQPTNGDLIESEEPLPHDLRFVSPLLEEGYPPAVLEYESDSLSEKPLLVYLPGFDGTVVAPFLQFPELGTIFDVRALTVGMSDRSTFDQVKEEVINFIINEIEVNPNAAIEETVVSEKVLVEQADTAPVTQGVSSSGRLGSFFANIRTPNAKESPKSQQESKMSSRSVYLMGESFGGILAADVALTLLQERGISNLKGLILVNAATCYDRSKLASEGPKVASLPKLFYPFGVLGLVPLFTDEYSIPQLLLILQSKALPSVIDTPAREAYMGRTAFSLPSKLKFMPQETLKWRLEEWLEEGCARMETRLDKLKTLKSLKTLIVAGEMDMALPSIAEAERLTSMIPRSQVHVVEGAGHASTCGSRVDLAALIRGCFNELQKGGGGILKFGRGDDRGRTAMKPEAADGEGVYFGLEPRYNGEEVGLSPLKYWSKGLYRKWDKNKKTIQPNGKL